MDQRTINGKPLSQITRELSEPFNETDFKTDQYRHTYLPVQVYRERLNNVVGLLNYDFVIGEPKIELIKTRYHISLYGHLTLRDDNGTVVTTKSSCGGASVIIASSSDEAAAFKNDLETASADVFKRCCKLLNMAVNQLSSSKKGNVPTESQVVGAYRVTILEAFSSLGKDGYSALVSIDGETEKRRLILWKEAIDDIEKHVPMSEFIRRYKPGTSIGINAYKSVFNKKNSDPQLQLVMKSVCQTTKKGSAANG